MSPTGVHVIRMCGDAYVWLPGSVDAARREDTRTFLREAAPVGGGEESVRGGADHRGPLLQGHEAGRSGTNRQDQAEEAARRHAREDEVSGGARRMVSDSERCFRPRVSQSLTWSAG